MSERYGDIRSLGTVITTEARQDAAKRLRAVRGGGDPSLDRRRRREAATVAEDVREMATGSAIHQQHGRKVIAAGCLRTLAMIMLLSAMVLFVVHFLGQAL